MVNKCNKRRLFQRYFTGNSAFVLKDANGIRMGPLLDISLGGFSFGLVPFIEKKLDYLNESHLSLRVENLNIENFVYQIAYMIEKDNYSIGNETHCQMQIGIRFMDLDTVYRTQLERFLAKSSLEIVGERRTLCDRRTGLNRRRCDLPHYQSGFRDGRDRRKSEDRRKF